VDAIALLGAADGRDRAREELGMSQDKIIVEDTQHPGERIP
jgi:hypothetical protein